MTEWTPTCDALPPANELCVGVYDGPEDEHPVVRLVCLIGEGEWRLADGDAWIDACPPRLWALVPALGDLEPCPVGGEIVDYEANVCSCGRVGGVKS
jgi:hypothetical protein